MAKLLLATQPTYTKAGRYVERGQLVSADEVDYDENSTNLIEAPAGAEAGGVVEISAIAPTGPNPQNPQQLPIGAFQTPGGYVQDGATLVGEVTNPAEKRFEIIDRESNTQALITEALDEAGDVEAKAADKARAAEAKTKTAKAAKAADKA